MKIIDLNGCAIAVTDLDDAIRKAKEFKAYSHVPPNPMDSRLQLYWTDMYGKLSAFKDGLTQQQSNENS